MPTAPADGMVIVEVRPPPLRKAEGPTAREPHRPPCGSSNAGETCPDCGGPLRLLDEDVSELLDFAAARLKVVETNRLTKSCRRCEAVVQPAAPTRPVPRSAAGPGLLAHVLVSKFDDHLPPYRQGEILARMGADVPRSTLIDRCGRAVATLRPAR